MIREPTIVNPVHWCAGGGQRGSLHQRCIPRKETWGPRPQVQRSLWPNICHLAEKPWKLLFTS